MSPKRSLCIHYPNGSRSLDLTTEDQLKDLTDLLRSVDLPLNERCGRQGLCRGCQIELLSGSLVNRRSGEIVTACGKARPLRACEHTLACGHTLACDETLGLEEEVAIRIPARSLLGHEPQIVSSFRLNVPRAHSPLWQHFLLDRDDLSVDMSMTDAVVDHLSRKLDDPLPIRCEPESFSELSNGDAISLLMEYRGDHWALRPLPESIDVPAYGVAVDIGTTTVVLMLVDLQTGDVVGTASALNLQTQLGDNVLTRIALCLSDPASVLQLQEAVTRGTLAPLLHSVLREADVSIEQVAAFSLAANTTMLHLVAGVDPSAMGAAPFPPTFVEHQVLSWQDLPCSRPDHPPTPTNQSTSGQSTSGGRTPLRRTDDSPDASENGKEPPAVPEGFQHAGRRLRTTPAVHLLPSAAAYVGADITSGVLSSGMAYRNDPCLFVDIGTNGEIVMCNGDHLVGCATAAGPAFEGAGLKCGVRAAEGAISHIRLVDDPEVFQTDVIGNRRPIGICGTAYIDFIAQAYQHGLINHRGRMTDAWKESDHVLTLRRGKAFEIIKGKAKDSILISEADIASLLQAKAAIATGILCLLRRCNCEPSGIVTLYLAGGFGFHMDLDNLIACGLLPGFSVSQIHVVGNTSLAGAYLALVDAGAIAEMQGICQRMELVELNLEPDFTDIYTDQLWLGDGSS